jgi:Ser/Thr protein kinase RdoA (MazF antagonist)
METQWKPNGNPMESQWKANAKTHRDDAMAPWRLKRRCRIFTRSFASRLRRLRREGFWVIEPDKQKDFI